MLTTGLAGDSLLCVLVWKVIVISSPKLRHNCCEPCEAIQGLCGVSLTLKLTFNGYRPLDIKNSKLSYLYRHSFTHSVPQGFQESPLDSLLYLTWCDTHNKARLSLTVSGNHWAI